MICRIILNKEFVMNIAVIFGGESCEHDISIMTGVQLLNKLNEYLYNIVPIYIDKDGVWFTGNNLKDIDNYPSYLGKLKEVSFVANDCNLYIKKGAKLKKYLCIDMAFVCLHGQRGEDGSVSGILEMSKIPYSSSSMLASSVSMDKVAFKYLLKGLDVNCVDGFEITKDEYLLNKEYLHKKIEGFGLPIIIKPSRQGSSIGIKICKSINELENQINLAFNYDSRLLIEKFINVKKEVNIAVLKHKKELLFSNTEEPIYANEILDFDDKYRNSSNGFETIKRISPAQIDIEQLDMIKSMASKVYKILDMFGVVRFDFIVDVDDQVYLNEVNSIPGSMANYLFKDAISYDKLIDMLILNSLIRKEESGLLIKKFDSDVLEQGFGGLKK